MSERKLRIGSLFAGVGGFDLGFERAGFETAWAVEIDEKAQAVLRLRFPKAELHDDVCAVGAHNLGSVDVITYGFPCQDLSVAGKRAGLDGQRSGLFHEAVRVIRELRARDGKPDIAIAENVPGLFSSNAGRDFAVVLQTLVDIGARDVSWRVLDSQHHGVAQRRRRVFIISDFAGERAAKILSLGEGMRGDSAPRRASRKGVARGAQQRAESGNRPGPFWNGADVAEALTRTSDDQRMPDKGRMQMVVTPIGPVTENQGEVTWWDGRPVSQTLDAVLHKGQMMPEKNRFPVIALGERSSLPPTATTTETAQFASLITPSVSVLDRLRTTSMSTAKTQTESSGRVYLRRITPMETARLQGFPDDWNAEGIDKQGKRIAMADSSRYKQMGNAVTVNVAQAIAERVAMVLGRSS